MNTIDKNFVIALLGAIPDMDDDTAQGWIDNPNALKKVLLKALCPPRTETREEKEDADIVIRVTPDFTLSSKQALDATGRAQYADDDVIDIMPKATEEGEKEVVFFKVGVYQSDEQLEQAYAKRQLIPCDPHTLCKVNENDPAFADSHPNGTHWKDDDGKWYYAAFLQWGDERGVRVDRRVSDWIDGWWFAGLRK